MPETVREIMTEPRSLGADASIGEAARLMAEHDIGDVVVLEGERLAGIVTDRDIAVRAVAEGRDPGSTTVGEISSMELVTLEPSDTVTRAAEVMRENALRRLPIVEDGRVVGIVSIGDLAIERDERSALADISAAEPNT